MPDQRRNPKLKGWGCDSVLPAQGYRTPHGVVMNEYEAVMESCLAGENQRNSQRNPHQGHFVHHEAQIKSPRTKLKAAQWMSKV
jgi:hypothetical protein